MAFRWLELYSAGKFYAEHGEHPLYTSKIAYRALMKHYENERFCKTCNHRFYKAVEQLEAFERVKACVTNNHKHWER